LDPNYYQVLEGEVQTAITLTQHPGIDNIVFTGGSITGKSVAEAAAKNLTPCILELGGKNCAIVDETADL